MSDFILSQAELQAITGYKPAKRQLAALHLAGFYRARFGPAGGVILERAHYDAVCAGVQQPQRPIVHPPRDAKRHAPRVAAQGL